MTFVYTFVYAYSGKYGADSNVFKNKYQQN